MKKVLTNKGVAENLKKEQANFKIITYEKEKKHTFTINNFDMKIKTNSSMISVDPEVLGGTPVFRGTRVPIERLFEYLEGNYSLKEFLDDFPSVKKEQAFKVLKSAEMLLVSG